MSMRIAIVGNGIIGLSLAFSLCRRRDAPEIRLYGPRGLAAANAGSAAAPAMINVFGEVTTRFEGSWAARHMLQLGRAAQRAWPGFVAQINADRPTVNDAPLTLHSGTYILARPDKQDELDNLRAIITALDAEHCDYEEISSNQIPASCVASPERFEKGVYVPAEGFIDARNLLRSLDACLRTRPNVEFVEAMADRIDPAAGIVEDEHGDSFEADAIVLANSFGFNKLVRQAGLGGIPYMLPIYGAGLLLPRATGEPVCARTPVYGASCGDYAVHFPNHLYVGASALANTDKVEITTHLQRSLEFFNARENLNGVSLVGGIRAMSQDTYPVVGRLCERLWSAVGFFKSGVTLAPNIAEQLACDLMGDPVQIANRFVPHRNVDDKPPAFSELVRTILLEIEKSATSAGSRASIRKYRWLVKLLLKREVKKVVGALDQPIYYNSDIVQKCLYDDTVVGELNKYRPAIDAAVATSAGSSHLD